jgi:alpha-beta hydrolase superfamily lysophospholipase
MENSHFKIDHIPAIRWGKPSEKVYLFVHGKCGCKEEAEVFAEIACTKGWQVLSIDLPEHGERKDEANTFDPWHVVPEMKYVMGYAKQHWINVALNANSIGAWFSMLSYADESLVNCLFVSPIVDMERLIRNMMQWADVSEERLEQEKSILTAYGETLSWEYYTYAKQHPVSKWEHPTAILYAEKDNLTERGIAETFAKKFSCRLAVVENGEHWFHTPEQLAVLGQWISENI